MTDFLVVADIPVPVSVSAAAQSTNEFIGNESRAYGGGLRSTVRDEKRGWQFTTATLSPSDDAALVAATAGGVFVDCSGDALGATVRCRVTITNGPYVKTVLGFRRTRVITLREV